MTGVDGKPITGLELVLAWTCIVLLISFVIYVFFYKPHVVKQQINDLNDKEKRRREAMSSAEREKEDEEIRLMNLQRIVEINELKKKQDIALNKSLYGSINKALFCPHCQTKGFVRKQSKTRVTKTRVNSIPARVIGLGTNTENQVTAMRCDNCETEWDVA